MTNTAILKDMKKIARLSKKYDHLQEKAFYAETTLQQFVSHVIIIHDLENDLATYKAVIDLLPACIFKMELIKKYIDIENEN